MLSAAPTDVDLDLKAFKERIDSHLVGKWINIASRTEGFVHKLFAGKLADHGCFSQKETDIYAHLVKRYARLPELYAASDFAEVTREFVLAADFVNSYIAEIKPWALVKDEARRDELHAVCTFAISAFRLLTAMLKPLVPIASEEAEKFLGISSSRFNDVIEPMYGKKIGDFQPLVTRIDPKKIETMIENSKDSLQATPAATVSLRNPRPRRRRTRQQSPSTTSPNSTSASAKCCNVDL